jgi:hypothetical protein
MLRGLGGNDIFVFLNVLARIQLSISSTGLKRWTSEAALRCMFSLI